MIVGKCYKLTRLLTSPRSLWKNSSIMGKSLKIIKVPSLVIFLQEREIFQFFQKEDASFGKSFAYKIMIEDKIGWICSASVQIKNG